MKKPFVSFSNKMIAYTLIHAALLTLIYFWFGPLELVSFITVAAIGILLLETVIKLTNSNGAHFLYLSIKAHKMLEGYCFRYQVHNLPKSPY